MDIKLYIFCKKIEFFFLPWLRERFFTKYSKRKQKITQLKQQKVKQCLKIKSSLGDSRTMSNTFTFAL